jgi:hypothetical protein
MTTQAHTAHEIRFDDGRPILIRYVLEGPWFDDLVSHNQYLVYDLSRQGFYAQESLALSLAGKYSVC